MPNPQYFNPDNVAQRGRRLGYAKLLATAYVERDPTSYTEGMRLVDADQWSVVCQYEIDALSASGTWELVDLLPNRKAVKSKWVFKLKMNSTYRACLVANVVTHYCSESNEHEDWV